jgi:lactose/L-arabinose transport system ATP-binding protein
LPAAGTPVILGIRPEHIEVHQDQGDLRAELSEALGGVSYLHLKTQSGERIIAEERGDLRARAGAIVDISFAPERALLFDARTEQRLR